MSRCKDRERLMELCEMTTLSLVRPLSYDPKHWIRDQRTARGYGWRFPVPEDR